MAKALVAIGFILVIVSSVTYAATTPTGNTTAAGGFDPFQDMRSTAQLFMRLGGALLVAAPFVWWFDRN